MGIILDIAVIAIIILSTFLGYKKGLINVIFNLCAFLLALIITIFLYTPITNFVINNTEIDDKIEEIIIQKGITEEDENSKYVSQSIKDTKNDIVESASNIIAKKLTGIIVAIALFIVIRILLIFAKALINGIASLPIIKQLNKIGGLAYGALRGVVILYVVLAVLFFIISVNSTGSIANLINTSYIAKILYNNNIILNIIF